MTSASSTDKGCKLTCEEVANICEETTLRKQDRGIFVSGHEAFIPSALQVAGEWASNLLKLRLLLCEVVMSLHNEHCAWTAREKDRGDFRTWCSFTSVIITL